MGMSFSKKVKSEISQRDFGKFKREMSCGLVYFSRNFSSSFVGIQTESEPVALLYQKSIELYTKRSVDYSFGGDKKRAYTVMSASDGDALGIFDFYSKFISKIFLDIEKKGSKSTIIAPFLTGAFLACGNISAPQKLYYMDFTLAKKEQCDIILNLLKLIGLSPKMMVRGSVHTVYIKDSGNIEDLLTYMGATKATLELIDVKIYKEIRNIENRKNNFEIANIEKTAIASASQIFDIEYIINKKGWDFFTGDIKDVAQKRYENPDLSLDELGKILVPPLSRSSTNRRLSKIRDMAAKLRSKQKDVKKYD